MRAKPPAAAAAKPATGALHPRNRHHGRYDLAALTALSPELAAYIVRNPHGEASINFTIPAAVKALNRALLMLYYRVDGWDIPAGYLCPPIPGRADYIHNLADLLASGHKTGVPRGENIRVLDVGSGANCVYPLIGHAEYGWSFVGSDVDAKAQDNAAKILAANPALEPYVERRHQAVPDAIFHNVIGDTEYFDVTMCNPPFHASEAEASAGSRQKWQNLGRDDGGKRKPKLNFGGHGGELWCPGGEEAFICQMVAESVEFADRVYWFTSLVSKATTLHKVNKAMKQAGVKKSYVLEMSQGQKVSRVVAWTFMDRQQQNDWRQRRWPQPDARLPSDR